MDDEVQVEDRRKIKQQDLGPAAVVRTTTLKPAETGDIKPSKSMKTEAQQIVAAAKARDEGRDSALEPQKKPKAAKPPWSKDNKALDERRVDRPKLGALQQTSPLENAELYSSPDNLNWCGKCGRALYILQDDETKRITKDGFPGVGQPALLAHAIRCRDGHDFDGAISWESAARLLHAEHTALEVGALMATSASDVAAFWAEEALAEAKEAKERADSQPVAAIVAGLALGTRRYGREKDKEEVEPEAVEEEYERSMAQDRATREESLTRLDALIAASRIAEEIEPIKLLLTCPMCGERHIDEGEYAQKPHHTHACQHCGMTWRPAIQPTVGVRFLPGFKDGES